MSIMGTSIQDYLKEINSKVTYLDCASLTLSTVLLVLFVVIANRDASVGGLGLTYAQGDTHMGTSFSQDSTLPYGSISGTTYTYAWCRNSSQIKAKNKIVFANEADAVNSGRRISTFCK